MAGKAGTISVDRLRVLVSVYMTADPICVAPHEDIVCAAIVMARHSLRCLPVVDGERLVGIVSRSDLAHVLPAHLALFSPEILSGAKRGITLRDVMVSPVVTVAPDDPLDTAVSLLDLHKLSCVVVVRADRVVGVLSRTDILLAFRDTVFVPAATRVTMVVDGNVDVIAKLMAHPDFAQLRLRAYAEHPHANERLVEFALEGPEPATDAVLAMAAGDGARLLCVRRPGVPVAGL